MPSLPIAHFVDVSVAVGGAAIDRFSFGRPMGVFEHTVTANRQDGPYSTAAEVATAGFATSSEPYKWANTVFSQSPAPDAVMIGRKIAAGGDPVGEFWQVDDTPSGTAFVNETVDANDVGTADVTVFPATEAVGDFCAIGHNEKFAKVTFNYAGGTAGIGGVVVWEYWDGTAWAALTGVTDNTTGFTAAVANGLTLTFTIPTDWARRTISTGTSLYFIRARITTVYTTNPVLDQVFIAGDVGFDSALTAIEADDPDSWYATTIGSRADADILAAAAWMESRTKIFVAQSDDPDLPAGVGGNIADQLQALNYNQTALIYHALDAEYLDGAWAGRGSALNLDVPDGVGTWGLKQLAGVTVDSLGTSQATAIWADNANLYGSLKGINFTADGTMASARFIDITTTNHWFEVRLQEEILATLVGATTNIDYDQTGLNLIGAAIQAVCDRGVLYGHFNGDDSPPLVKIPKFSTISTQDKTDRKATYIVNVTYRNSIQTVVIAVNASF
jgi:hypothetical protein